MKTLFPEFEKDIALSRLAERRESRQRAREYLAGKSGYEKWILKKLSENGEMADASMMVEIASLSDVADCGEAVKSGMNMMLVAHAMWVIGKLKRKEFKGHPSGQLCFIYSLRHS